MSLDDAALDIIPWAARIRVGLTRHFTAVKLCFLQISKREILWIQAIPKILRQQQSFGRAEL